jgi:hypothetical protein
MRQNYEKEKEVRDFFAYIIIDAKEFLEIDDLTFISYLVSLIGCTLPNDLDEEALRDFSRLTFRRLTEILHDRNREN